MHPEFGTWYRIAEPTPTHELLTGRWGIVENIGGDVGRFPDALLLSIAHRFHLGAFDAEGRTAFCSIFQEADASFDVRGVVEHAILAAAAVVCRMEDSDEDIASRSAMAVVCGSCAGLRSDGIPKELNLLPRAHDALRKLAASRWPDSNGSPGELDLGVELEELRKQAEQTPVQPQVAQSIIGSLQAIKKHLDRVSDDLRRRTRREDLLSEECNMLWWLAGGYSAERDMPYKQMKAGEAALVAGKELADLTRLPPGPVSVPAFLRKVLSVIENSSESTPLAEAVTACDIAWRRSVVGAGNSKHADFVAPIHVAIGESIKSPTWNDAFTTRTGLSSAAAVVPCQLASQLYMERLYQLRTSND